MALANILDSPTLSGDDSTVHHGRTLPDVSLGSLGSSFRSEDQEDGRKVGRTPVSKAPRLPVITSSDTSQSTDLVTPSPSQLPASALLSLSPPSTVRRASSHPALPDGAPGSHAPRRNRVLRRNSTSSASSDDGGALNARYSHETEDDAVLSTLSLNISPKVNGAGRKSYGGGPSKRSGRHSVAADISTTGPLTLRDQEQQLNAAKKDIFNLQLENHFLKERLSNMAPDHIEAALNENVKIKLEILNMSKEMKRLKKILTQQDKDLADAAKEREMRAGRTGARELEEMYAAEKERRKQLERAVEDEAGLREQLEDEVEQLKGLVDDVQAEVERLRDEKDRAEDEIERAKAGLGESVGLSKGREGRLIAKLEEENEALQQELERVKANGGDVDDLEDRINELMDNLAAAQLDVDRRDSEIEQLNEELDNKVRAHEDEIQQVEAEWRDELVQARAQVDELKDALEQRELDTKDLRDALAEREDELLQAHERVAELEGAQAETHDRLEQTLGNIERDNAEKDADLIEANREVEALGQRIYELEEACEELKAREMQLDGDLKSADEAFDQAKAHYENLVTALKEARKKLQDERDDALEDVRGLEAKRAADKENARREKETELEKMRRALSEREQVNARLQAELDSARDRVTQRDRDLSAVQASLRSAETERRKLGDERTSAKHGLELEIERMERDLVALEDDLARAREEVERGEGRLRQRDIEMAAMLDKQRDLENRLSSERQGRLNISDKLDLANKASGPQLNNARQYEREAARLQDRIEELEPMLTETQQEQFKTQRQSEQQRQERTELLLRVFKDVNRFLGQDDIATPANFGVFRDTLLTRLRTMLTVRTDFEKRIKQTEANMEKQVGSLKRQLDSKWRALDNFEASVKKLEATKMQWRAKYATKEGELDAVKARNAELSQQVASIKAGSSSSDSTQLRSITERAEAAERRAVRANNTLASLEAKLAEMQGRAGQAEDKWAARVKEYENRLRVAGEKIKTEKQGGKERARALEEQVRELERQVDAAKRRSRRAEDVVATAHHLLPDSP